MTERSLKSAFAPVMLNDDAGIVTEAYGARSGMILLVDQDGGLGIGRHNLSADETLDVVRKVEELVKRTRAALEASMRSTL